MVPHLALTKRHGPRIFSLSLLAALGATACGGIETEGYQSAGGDVREPDALPPSARAVPFEEFTDDVGTRATNENRTLIRTARGYQEFFGHAPPAGVDFAKQWVIFYSAGTRPTGGFDANILSLMVSGEDLVAVTELVSPGPECGVTDALTSPYVLIKFAAQIGTAIDFRKKDRVQHCGCTPPPKVTCGGIAGIQCPGLGTCVDDPSDSCDPNKGGADCGGVCQCSAAAVTCPVGAAFDSSPEVCTCVPKTPPTCGPVCAIACPYGNVLDDKGCPTCSCNPPPDPCAAILCQSGTHCEKQEVVCVTAPCPPIGVCVPDAPKVSCGGIAGIQCPGIGKCIDDPTDSCDPTKGGADCGGICQCIENVACIRGTVFDGSPKVCSCVPAPIMCGAVCTIFCEYGNVLDANGCPTCACNPPPANACSWEKCPAPAPGAANYVCPDGKTIAGPACLAQADGSCGWSFVSCPTPAK